MSPLHTFRLGLWQPPQIQPPVRLGCIRQCRSLPQPRATKSPGLEERQPPDSPKRLSLQGPRVLRKGQPCRQGWSQRAVVLPATVGWARAGPQHRRGSRARTQALDSCRCRRLVRRGPRALCKAQAMPGTCRPQPLQSHPHSQQGLLPGTPCPLSRPSQGLPGRTQGRSMGWRDSRPCMQHSWGWHTWRPLGRLQGAPVRRRRLALEEGLPEGQLRW